MQFTDRALCTHSDCKVYSLLWQCFVLGKADYPLRVTSNRCIAVKNTWVEMQSCFVRVR